MVVSAGLMVAQSGVTPSERLLKPYGLSNFSVLYWQAVDALFTAYPAYRRGDFATASGVLDDFWKRHPAGSQEWAAAQGEGERAARTIGVEYGDPPCYSALRMLTECVRWRLEGAREQPKLPPLRFTVVLLGHSHGIQPTSIEELHEQRGPAVRNTLDRRLLDDAQTIIDDCFGLLFDYIHAFTGGRLKVETRILPYPDMDVAMRVFDDPGQPSAQLVPGALERIWSGLDPEVKASTDWWYILYPSHRPEQYAAFAHTDFSNGGGITPGPETGAALQLGDERVLLTKPPKYGGQPVTHEERIAFFSQVMQHEFFHELFWLYPEFQLEATSHQWFNRSAWPADFVGVNESDYYSEALHKRLLPLGNPPVWAKLRYVWPPDLAAKIPSAGLLGAYRRQPVTNGWHEGTITSDAGGRDGVSIPLPGFRWTNHAGKSWHLDLAPDKRFLLTRPDNPYFQSALGKTFRIALRQGESGEFLPEVAGFWFNGEFYAKLPDPQ